MKRGGVDNLFDIFWLEIINLIILYNWWTRLRTRLSWSQRKKRSCL